MTEQRKSRKVHPVLIAAYAFLALLVALTVSLMLAKASGKIPSFFGYSVLRIVSPSMEDAIPTGEYILIRKTDPASIQAGDVITFYSTDPSIYMQPNTHRVVERKETGGTFLFVTKGDNNPVADTTAVPAANVIGKYQCNLPFLTKVGGIFQNKIVFLLLILIPAAGFLLTELVHVIKVSHSIKQEASRVAFLQKEKERLRKGEDDPHDNA